MKTLNSLDYNQDFYWKGFKYRQFMRLRDRSLKGKITCYKRDNYMDGYVDMPPGRMVKPICRIHWETIK